MPNEKKTTRRRRGAADAVARAVVKMSIGDLDDFAMALVRRDARAARFLSDRLLEEFPIESTNQDPFRPIRPDLSQPVD